MNNESLRLNNLNKDSNHNEKTNFCIENKDNNIKNINITEECNNNLTKEEKNLIISNIIADLEEEKNIINEDKSENKKEGFY